MCNPVVKIFNYDIDSLINKHTGGREKITYTKQI